MIAALASAFAFGTVLPAGRSRPVCGATMTALPVTGLVVGMCAAGALGLGRWLFGPASLLAGLFAVVTAALLSRGLHLDGLADTADGLGCFGPPERALTVMRTGTAGPFGVAAVVIAVIAQSAAFAAVAPGLSGAAAVVAAVTTGRVAAVLVARRGVPAAPGSTLGSLVAGTQSPAVLVAWVGVAAVLSVPAAPMIWQGPLVVLATLVVTAAVVVHCVRRFGGVTGDVFGAAVELSTTLVALGLAARTWA